MSIFSPLGPTALVRVNLAAITLTASTCSPLTPKEDAVQSSAQNSAENTNQGASQIGNCRIIPLSGISPDALEKFCELSPETKAVPNDVLLEKLTKEVEDAETVGIMPEEYFRNAIEAARMNDEAMWRTVGEAIGDVPAQSH